MSQRIVLVAVLLVASAITMIFLRAETPVSAMTPIQGREAAGFQYARLIVEDEGDTITWIEGSTNQLVRQESLRETYRRMGGTMKATFANLLDLIGSENWRLVQKDDTVWIFIR